MEPLGVRGVLDVSFMERRVKRQMRPAARRRHGDAITVFSARSEAELIAVVPRDIEADQTEHVANAVRRTVSK